MRDTRNFVLSRERVAERNVRCYSTRRAVTPLLRLHASCDTYLAIRVEKPQVKQAADGKLVVVVGEAKSTKMSRYVRHRRPLGSSVYDDFLADIDTRKRAYLNARSMRDDDDSNK